MKILLENPIFLSLKNLIYRGTLLSTPLAGFNLTISQRNESVITGLCSLLSLGVQGRTDSAYTRRKMMDGKTRAG